MHYKHIKSTSELAINLKRDLTILEINYSISENRKFYSSITSLPSIISKYFKNSTFHINSRSFMCISIHVESNIDIIKELGFTELDSEYVELEIFQTK